MREIKAFKTHDGTIYEYEIEAQLHEKREMYTKYLHFDFKKNYLKGLHEEEQNNFIAVLSMILACYKKPLREFMEKYDL